MVKPTKPTPPDRALRSNPSTFSANAEAWITYQWGTFPDYVDAVADFTDEQADAALAAALGGDLPPLTGKALQFLRVNAGETAAEFADALVPSDLVNLSQVQVEDDTSTVFGQVSGQRLAQAGVVSFTDQERQIGVGQTWVDVSGSRATGVSYQNTTGRPIEVAAQVTSSSINTLQVSVDNSTWVTIREGASGANTILTAIIQDQIYYRASGSLAASPNWWELR